MPGVARAALRRAVRQTNRRHDLIAVHIEDPREQELPNVGIIALEDAETGEIIELDTARTAVRKRFNELSSGALSAVCAAICEPRGSTPCSCARMRPTFLPLQRFFKSRGRHGYEWRLSARRRTARGCAWLASLPGTVVGRSRGGHPRHSRAQGRVRVLGATRGRLRRRSSWRFALYVVWRRRHRGIQAPAADLIGTNPAAPG